MTFDLDNISVHNETLKTAALNLGTVSVTGQATRLSKVVGDLGLA